MAKPNVSGRRVGGSSRLGGAPNRNPSYLDANNSSQDRLNEMNAVGEDSSAQAWARGRKEPVEVIVTETDNFVVRPDGKQVP